MSDVFGDVVVDTGGQSQVEEAVGLRAAGQSAQVCVQLAEGALIVILPTQVRVPAEERRETLRFSIHYLRGRWREWERKRGGGEREKETEGGVRERYIFYIAPMPTCPDMSTTQLYSTQAHTKQTLTRRQTHTHTRNTHTATPSCGAGRRLEFPPR